MARKIKRLTALDVSRMTQPGLHPDGGGLYLQVTAAGTGSWVLRYRRNGKRRDMGLGPAKDVPLADARRRAERARQTLSAGLDPIEARRTDRTTEAAREAQAVTFKACAALYIDAHKPSWRNAKHAAQWSATLATYAYPKFGDAAVANVDTNKVMGALEPIWTKKPETASRLRGRVESVLDYAKVRGWRAGENPARWRGHLENLLPARSKVRKVRHHAALPWKLAGAFMAQLKEQGGTAARALEFTIKTAARTTETIGARWSEIDWEEAAWEVPPDRMKGGKPHRVPLTAGALSILQEMLPSRDKKSGDWIFPGGKAERGLSDAAMSAVIDRMNEVPKGEPLPWVDPKRNNHPVTVHGFRSTFRDWVSEATAWPGELAEASLAHVIKSKVEGAYRRGDLFHKRALLLADWERHCGFIPQGAEVVTMAAHRLSVLQAR